MVGYRSVILLSVLFICFSFGDVPKRLPYGSILILFAASILMDFIEFKLRFDGDKQKEKEKG